MGYLDEYKNWNNIRSEAHYSLCMSDYQVWLKNNPEPVLSEAEHRTMLNKCLAEAKIKNDKRKKIFCPVAKGCCETTCECYEKATVYNTIVEKNEEKGGYLIPKIEGGYCTAFILKGK